MKSSLLMMCLFVIAPAAANGQEGERSRHVSIQSTYLRQPVGGFYHFALVADLAGSNGEGWMELNPNECDLNSFGDPDICTEIAKTECSIRLVRLRTADPSGLNRQLWAIADAPISGTAYLVVPEAAGGPYRFVIESWGGRRTVLGVEPLVYTESRQQQSSPHEQCDPLARTVDGVRAEVQLRPGIIEDTYFLNVQGRKPGLNTRVALKPVWYPSPPRYWRIDVMECRSGDIVLPTISPYSITSEVSRTMGKQGIELHWANGEVERIEKP